MHVHFQGPREVSGSLVGFPISMETPPHHELVVLE